MLPRPHDPRDLFDFSGARELIDAAYELANDGARPAPTVPPATAEQRRRFRFRRGVRVTAPTTASNARATRAAGRAPELRLSTR